MMPARFLPVILAAAMLGTTPRAATAQTPPPMAFGTNVGHWLSQAKLDRAEMAAFFTEEDVRRIKGWGMDHIRLPVDYPLFAKDGEPDAFSEEGLGWIDRAVTWTAKARLTLIVDMHDLPGHHFMREGANTIWKPDSAERRHAVNIWKTLAARYRKQPHVVLELLNEAVAPESQPDLWHDLARDLVAAIRSVNPTSWIMVGSNRWNSAATFDRLPKLDDPRIVYTFHMYEPFLFTHQKASWAPQDIAWLPAPVPYPGPMAASTLNTDWLARSFRWMTTGEYGTAYLRERLQKVLAFKKAHGVPVYCGEFGVVTDAPSADRLRWYRDLVGILRAEGIGFSNWNYKSGNFGLVSEDGRPDPELLAAVGARP